MNHALYLAAALALAGCGTTGGFPSVANAPTTPDPKVADAIGKACMSSGLFKSGNGVLATFVPAAALPVGLVNAGIDQICADPMKFAGDVTTVEFVVKQFNAAVAGKGVAQTPGK